MFTLQIRYKNVSKVMFRVASCHKTVDRISKIVLVQLGFLQTLFSSIANILPPLHFI